MRILYYFGWAIDELGGAEIGAQNLAAELMRHGHDVAIVETSTAEPAGPWPARVFQGPVWSIRAVDPGHRRRPLTAVFAQFWSIVSKFGPDILSVQCPSWGQAAPVIGALALPHRWRLVVALHGSELLDEESPTAGAWRHRLFNAAAAVTTVSESLGSDFQMRYPTMAHKVRVIPNGLDPRWSDAARSDAPAESQGSEQPRYVLYVGRLDRIKGVDVLLRAWKRIDAAAHRVELRLAGTGPEEDRLRALALNLGVANRVRFVGRVAHQDLPAVFRDATFVVMPSRHEGMPLVALEAGACGAVCVGTRVGGIPEVIDDRVTGLLVAPESADALADGLERGLRMTPEDRRRMGAAARSRILQHFTHARSRVAHEWLFQSLLEPLGQR